MHDERNFSNPESFIPGRWLPDENTGETCNRAAWVPFSYGPRNCIGKPYVQKIYLTNFSLALMELRLVIAMFVWHFDAEFVEEGQAEPHYKDAFVVLRGPFPVRITPVLKKLLIQDGVE